MTPEGYILLIKKKYLDARSKKISRFDMEWGMWSVKMNRVLKEKTLNEKDSDCVKYRYVFIYWSVLSELLELYFRYRILKSKQKKELQEQASEIQKIVTSKEPIKFLSLEDIVPRITKGVLQ